jgi:hypothetical protein
MKNLRTIILVALFIIGIVISSCNRKLCPAYTKTATEQVAGKG